MGEPVSDGVRRDSWSATWICTAAVEAMARSLLRNSPTKEFMATVYQTRVPYKITVLVTSMSNTVSFA